MDVVTKLFGNVCCFSLIFLLSELFEVDQDFPIEISKLNASELLLVQFQPEATLADVEEAASEFLDLSVEAKELEAKKRKSSNTSTSTIDSTDLGSLVSDMNVESFKLEKANGGGNSESGDLSMGIHSKGLLITQDGDEEIWKMDSEDITGVLCMSTSLILLQTRSDSKF